MISPDHRFAFPHRSYVQAKTYLEYGLMRKEGLVLVTGPPGTGKSTVINDLIADHEGDDMFVARMLATQFEVDDLLRMLAYSFGMHAEGLDKASVLAQLEHFLYTQFESGKRVLLIIDEAHHLSERALEELRLLTNIQHNDKNQLQIFLLGQPQLKELVKSADMEQLRQRIIASCEFEPLDTGETWNYIEHRLRIAGWQGDPEITEDAIGLLHHFSGGVPRQINMLCNRLLLNGSVDQKHRLDSDDVHQVIEELPLESVRDFRMQGFGVASQTVGTSNAEHSTVSVPTQHQVTHNSAHATNTLEEPVRTISDAGDSAPYREPVDNYTRYAPPFPAPKDADLGDLKDPAKPRVLRHDVRTNSRRRKSRAHRHLLTAVLVFAGVFVSSYTYFTWSPNGFEARLLNLQALVPDSIRLPVDWIHDDSSPSSRNASGEREPNTVDSDTKLDPHETFYGEDLSQNSTKSATLDNEHVGTNTPREQILPRSRADTPAARNQSDQGNPLATPKDQDETHLKPPESAVDFAVNEQNRSAPDDDETDQEDSANHIEPNDKEPVSVARITRHQTQATDSGVVEINGKWVISADLERALLAHSLHTQRLADGSVKITLKEAIRSEPKRTRLNTEASQSLKKLAFVLRNYEGFTVKVVALTDENTTNDDYLQLSRQHAQLVAKYLIVHGVPIQRVYSEARREHGPLIAVTNTGYRPKANHQIVIFLRPTA